MHRLYQLTNAMRHVTPNHSDLKQHTFIYSCFGNLGRAQLGLLISASRGVGYIHACICGQLAGAHGLSDMPSSWQVAWLSFAWLLRRPAWASQVTLAASQLHSIKLNPLKKYFTTFPEPLPILSGDVSQMFSAKTLPLELSGSASCCGVWLPPHIFQHGRVVIEAIFYHIPYPCIGRSCPQSSVALWGKVGTLLLSLWATILQDPPKQESWALILFTFLHPLLFFIHFRHGLGWE